MCENSANKDFNDIQTRIASAESLLLTTHARPDGDGLGACKALQTAARAAGKSARMILPDTVPTRYRFMFQDEWPAGEMNFDELSVWADLIVVLDTCAFAQLDKLADRLRPLRDRIVVIDHHTTCEQVGAIQWIDSTAAATGILVGELIESLGWPVDATTAEALMISAVSDTGWLRFANTDSRCLRATAKCLDAGLKTDELFRKMYETARPQRLMLEARMLNSLELHCDDQLASMVIRKADFEATGASHDETENLVNEALQIGTVEAVILLVQNDACVRVSLRSRHGVNVAEVAQQFGGGGHARAAGVRSTENIDTFRDILVQACTKAIENRTE